jgi:hypothetical protein
MELRYSFISTGKSKKNKAKEVVNEILPLGRKLFTNSEALGWINGLVCILSGEFDASIGIFEYRL